MSSFRIARRRLLGSAIAGFGLGWVSLASAQVKSISVYKDPLCGCCGGWVAHLRDAGFAASVQDMSDLEPIKKRLSVPADLWACHTATVDSYVLEGHVPAPAIKQLLQERLSVAGLAIPGMPVGSPGMEGGEPEIYEVIAFSESRRDVLGRYRGTDPV